MITKYIVRVSHKKDITEKTNNLICNQIKRFSKSLKVVMPDNKITTLIHQGGVNNISEEIR
jgi:hypothetical protein